MSCKIHNNAKYEGLDELAKNLYNFANRKFSFSQPVTIVFESSMQNIGKVFAPTGHYDPRTKKIIVFVDHRHPKDILRSLAHELVHHKQNCDGHFDGTISTDPGYAQRDQHMREMEGDAYRTGNIMLFRDWEDNCKQGSIMMNENKEKVEEVVEETLQENEAEETVQEEQGTTDKEWYHNTLNEALMRRFNIIK